MVPQAGCSTKSVVRGRLLSGSGRTLESRERAPTEGALVLAVVPCLFAAIAREHAQRASISGIQYLLDQLWLRAAAAAPGGRRFRGCDRSCANNRGHTLAPIRRERSSVSLSPMNLPVEPRDDAHTVSARTANGCAVGDSTENICPLTHTMRGKVPTVAG